MKSLFFYIPLWFALFKNSVQRLMEYRANFLGRSFTEICFISSQVIFSLAVSKGGLSVGGWSPMELLFFFGMLSFIDAFFMLLIHDNLHAFQDLMKNGSFDFYLLRPTSTLYLSLFRFPNAIALVNLSYAIGILIYSSMKLALFPSLPHLALGMIYGCIGLALVFCLAASVMCLGFFLTQSSALVWMFFEIYRLSFRPDDFYFSWLRRFLLSIFPAAFFISIPTKIILGKELTPWMYIGPWILLFIAIILLKKIWAKGIAHYDGAMS